MTEGFQMKASHIATLTIFVVATLVSVFGVAQTGTSPDGSSIMKTSALQRITDQHSNTWSLSDYKVLENGNDAGFTDNVSLVLYYNGNIYNENLSQSFHLWNGTAWVPSSDPRVVSLNGSLASAVGRLVDNNLNVWVTDGGIVYMNGSPAGYTNNVVQLLYFNNVVYQENQSSLWWFYDG